MVQYGRIQYVHSREAAEGMLFVQFIALSIRKYMRQRMNKEMQALDIPKILKRLRSMNATQLVGMVHQRDSQEMPRHL